MHNLFYSGTDPAGPLFQTVPINQRLDKTDASFVVIVHVNQGEFGFLGRLGHADFYVNGGGPIQSECGFKDITSRKSSFPLHFRSTRIFAL